MKISLEKKSNIDGIITVELLEEDYLEELTRTFNTIRTNFRRPGFRAGQVPYSLIYNLYGYKTLCDCCLQKTMDLMKDFIEKDEELKNLTLMKPILKDLKFPNKKDVNYKHPGDMSFEYFYAAVPSVDVEDIEEKCKDFDITKRIAGEISERDVEDVMERFKMKINKSVNINKVVDASNVVYFKNTDQKNDTDKNLFLPAQGCSIDGKALDFMGLTVGAEVELDIKDVLSLQIPKSSASYFEECLILARLGNGKQKLVVTEILAYEKLDISDEELLNYFKDNYNLPNIPEEERPNFANIDEYKSSIKESLEVYMSCLFERLIRTSVREHLIKAYDEKIQVSEEYLKYSLRNNFGSDAFKEFWVNNIRWICLRDALVKKLDVEVKEEDVEELTEAYELAHNPEVKNLEKCLDYGTFVGISDNKNKDEFMLEYKLTQELVKHCNVKEETLNFQAFTQFLKVRILENLSRYKDHESKN